MNVSDYISRVLGQRAGFALKACSFISLLAVLAASAQESRLAFLLHSGADAMRAGNPDEAAKFFTQAVSIAPRLPQVEMNLALALQQQGDFVGEISALRAALKLNPTLKGANFFLGVAYYKGNDYVSALRALNTELNINQRDPQVLMWIGVVNLAANNPEAGAQALDRAAKLAPNDTDILYHRGRAHLLVSQKSYERMYHNDPNSWRVHEVLAQAYAESDRQTDAIAEYKEVIRLAPKETGLHLELGDEYYAASQPENAENEYLAELQLDPTSIAAMYKLGSLRVDRGNPKEAMPLLKQLLSMDPGSADAYYYLGRAQDATGEAEQAAATLNQALKSNPSPDTLQRTYYQLSRVYRKLHLDSEAHAALAKFEELKQKADESQQKNLQDRIKRQERRNENTPVDGGKSGD